MFILTIEKVAISNDSPRFLRVANAKDGWNASQEYR